MSMIFSLVSLFVIGIIIGSIILVVVLVLRNKKSKPSQPSENETKRTLGEALKEQRTRCKMTQEFVAESIGVSRQAVSKWEKGDSDPSTSNLLELAKVFGVSAAELLESVE